MDRTKTSQGLYIKSLDKHKHLCLVFCCSAIYEQEWTVHGQWSESRRFISTTHVSCTLPLPVPVTHFLVVLKCNALVTSIKTWSLDQFSSEGAAEFVFQNQHKMYPPRAVLNFHIQTLGFIMPSGNCSFVVLSSRMETLSPDETPPPLLTTPQTASTSDTGIKRQSGTGSGPCKTLSTVFPSYLYTDETVPVPYDQRTTTVSVEETTTPNRLRPLPRPMPLPSSPDDSDPPFLLGQHSRPFLSDDGTTAGPSSPIPNTEENTETASTTNLTPFLKPALARNPARPSLSKRALPLNSDFSYGLIIPEIYINYTDAIEKSLYFYRAQRSGTLEFRDISMPDSWVRSSGTFHATPSGSSLTGGWYNGNDNVKLTFPMAAAVTVLSWGYVTWDTAYTESGLDQTFRDVVKWPLDYFLESWNSGTQTLFVQVGDLQKDRTLWLRADDDTYAMLWNSGQWPVYSVSPSSPGSDVASEVATALAVSSKIFLDDEVYQKRLLDTAKQIFQFAVSHKGKYSDHVPVTGYGYPDYTSSGYTDELCLAAMMLFDVTQDFLYYTQAIQYFNETDVPEVFSWDDKRAACAKEPEFMNRPSTF